MYHLARTEIEAYSGAQHSMKVAGHSCKVPESLVHPVLVQVQPEYTCVITVHSNQPMKKDRKMIWERVIIMRCDLVH